MSSQDISKAKPLHIGKAVPARLGPYQTQSYERSVVFTSTTAVVYPKQVEVFDIDHNGRFDTVFMTSNNSWLIMGTTEEFESKYHVVKQTLNEQETRAWVDEATFVKKTSKAKPLPVPIKTAPPPVNKNGLEDTEGSWWSPE